jgi:hypothetical protein
MKRHIVLIIILILLGLFIAFSAASHPYDGPPHNAPLTFIEHKTDDGRPIYTNIPKKLKIIKIKFFKKTDAQTPQMSVCFRPILLKNS